MGPFFRRAIWSRIMITIRDNYNCRPPILKAHIYRTWESNAIRIERASIFQLIKYGTIITHALTRFVFPSHARILSWPVSSISFFYNILHLGTWRQSRHDWKQRSSSTMAQDRNRFVLFALLLLSQFPLVKLGRIFSKFSYITLKLKPKIDSGKF